MKKRFFIISLFWVLAIAAFGAIVMLLWNFVVPGVLGLATINFWQAAGLLIRCRILLKGFGFPHPANTFRFNKEHIEMHDRMKHMTWDEKRAYIRSRMAKFHEQEAHE